MKLQSLEAFAQEIPFNAAFAHASATRTATHGVWVKASGVDGTIGYGEGAPREYVTRESLATARGFIDEHAADWCATIVDAGALADWAARHRTDVDAHPAAYAAVEIAILDLIGKSSLRSVESLLGLRELDGEFTYTAVLGDASARAFEAQLAHYLAAGFSQYKIKLGGDAVRDRAKVAILAASNIPPHKVRPDANNLWNDADTALRALDALAYPFCALEEPLRAGDRAGMLRIATARDCRIVLDESVVRSEQLAAYADAGDRWIANLRVSKMGGLVRSLEFVEVARRCRIPVVVGAHVGETSVLTRAALTVASFARDILNAQEGAFGTHLLQRDVADPPVMFGHGGVLRASALAPGAGGLGLRIAEPVPCTTALPGP